MITHAGEKQRAAGAKLAFALFIFAYFVYFFRVGIFAPFASDTFMNIHTYWRHEPLWLLTSQFQLWSGHYRPMGGLFYVTMFQLFGLNPVPYHVATAAILLMNACWVYLLSRTLGCDAFTGGLAALVVCYHAGVRDAYHNISFIYDVLCFFFYFAAFLFYARIRSRGRLLRAWETAVLLALYTCALNSKEMAVTFPAVLLVYELMYHGRPDTCWRQTIRWLRGPGLAVVLTGLLNVLYIYGKTHTPAALAKQSGYQPVLTWKRFLDFQTAQISDLLLKWDFPNAGALLVWLVLAYLAWRRRRPVLRFCFLFMALAPLPIEFLEARHGGCLHIPLAGWAVFGSVVFMDAARAMAAFVARPRRLSGRGAAIVEAAIVAAGIYYWAHANRKCQSIFVPAMAWLGGATQDVLRQLNALHPRVPPHSEVIFTNDPLNGQDMRFLSELWFHDRSITVRVGNMIRLAPEDLARIPYRFDFQDGKLIQIPNDPGTARLPSRPLVTVSPGTYDDSDPAIRFRGIWEKSSNFDGPAFHTITYSDSPSGELAFAFEGTALTYVFTKSFNRGRAEVMIDGARKQIVDLYSPVTEWKSRLRFCCFGGGRHVAVIRVLGEKSSRSSGNFVDLDCFIVE